MSKKNARLLKLEEEKRKEKEEAEKLRLLAEERERSLKLIQEEAKENALRKPIVEDTVVIFENLLQNVRDYKKPLREEVSWEKYLKCENLPDTNIPGDARSFLYKFDREFLEYHDKHLNWWLKCDVNSVMTQDIRIADTRRHVIDKKRDPTGRFYDQKLRFFMKVYENLEDSLRRKKMSSSRLEDLYTIRSSFRDKTFKFLDVLTFEIIMNIDREMKSMTPHISHYLYASPDFIKFIWSFKDVTLPQNPETNRGFSIQPLQMNVTMSSTMKLDTTSVRVLWFKRDFYSDYCPSYSPSSFDMKFKSFDHVIDKEMKKRKYFRDKRVAEMKKAREDYEIKMEELRIQQEAEEAAKKKNKNKTPSSTAINKSRQNKRLISDEPPIVDECTYVDVEDEYIEYENATVEDFNEMISPQNLNLTEHEVNMRKYKILGGIIKIECLERPLQTKEINQHLFIRLNDRPNVLKYRNFQHVYEEPVLKNVKEERKSQFAAKILDAKTKALSSLTKVELKLSDKIIWWESPKVCRWEEWEESDEFLQMDPVLQDFNLNYEKYQEQNRKKLFKVPDTQYQNKIHVKDFKLETYPENLILSDFLKFYLVPMMPIEYLHYVDKLEIFEKKQREWRFFREQQEEQHKIDEITERDEEMKTASIEAANTLSKFLKYFEMKFSKPRELFPVKFRKKIEVDENSDMAWQMRNARIVLQKIVKIKDEYEIDFEDEIPLKDEPLMLSELLNRMADIQKKLVPIFKKINITLTDVLDEMKPRISRKSKNRITRHRSSIFQRRSTRRSIKKAKKPSRTQVSKSGSINGQSDATTLDTTTETSTIEQKLFLIPHHKGKWVTKDIYESSYNEETKTFTFYIGRYGTFGLAVKKYFNLPFKNWELFPFIQRKAEKYVIMKIEGQKVSIEFKITVDGMTFKILRPGKAPIQHITKAVKIFELKKILTSMNINLFPEIDASWYITDNSEKHTSMEFHTYKSMASFCLSHHFQHHELNRYANRREIILKSKIFEKKNFANVLITPLRVNSVDVDMDEAEQLPSALKFEMNPLEQEFRVDLLNYLKSEVDKNEHRVNQRSFMIIWHVQALLLNIRPFSFSQ